MNQPAPSASLAPSPVQTYLHALHARYRQHDDGRLADYIPELARVDADAFGVCIATRDGHVYEVGDTRQPFTIQSISKALVYGLALEDRGDAEVLARIGVEPSGDAFNAISLRPADGAPFNPMINAGAIAATGLVRDTDAAARIDRIVEYLSACAGRPLDIDQDVYRSESRTGHRNRAIGWLLRNFEIVGEDPTAVLEAYFQQCSVRVTCRDLALMGATLANRGVNPVTGRTAIASTAVDRVLSVMATCGMYDYSGEWLLRVGLPAKSGVGGGILAVLPGELGIGIFSPRLDEHGNSARGLRVCQDLSRDLQLHLFRAGAATRVPIRRSYDHGQVSSRRRRPPAMRDVLAREGSRIQVLELQGELDFATTEQVVRAVHGDLGTRDHFVLDFGHVLAIDGVSAGLLAELTTTLRGRGGRLLVCRTDALGTALRDAGLPRDTHFADADAALEYCEDRLLAAALGEIPNDSARVSLAGCELFDGCSADELRWLDQHLLHRSYGARTAIVRRGDPGDVLYVVASGSVEIRVPDGTRGRGRRIEVVSAGMAFGEVAFIDRQPRSADAVALEPTACFLLDSETLARMERERPSLALRVLTAISRLVASHLRRTNAECAALAR